MPNSSYEIVHAYRQLYRHTLKAVQYAKPARFTCIDRLRYAFRTSSAADFDQVKIDRTLEFLSGAAREKGLEHKLLKNLALVWWHQDHLRFHKWRLQSKLSDTNAFRVSASVGDSINHTIQLLNESMGICIPTKPFYNQSSR
jgi:hypothetical protein